MHALATLDHRGGFFKGSLLVGNVKLHHDVLDAKKTTDDIHNGLFSVRKSAAFRVAVHPTAYVRPSKNGVELRYQDIKII